MVAHTAQRLMSSRAARLKLPTPRLWGRAEASIVGRMHFLAAEQRR